MAMQRACVTCATCNLRCASPVRARALHCYGLCALPTTSSIQFHRVKEETMGDALMSLLFVRGVTEFRSGHGPQAEVAQGVGPGPLVER